MKKIQIVLFLAMASIMVFAISCGGSSSPGDISVKFIKNIEKGNVEAAMEVFAKNGKEMSEDDIAKLNALVLMSQEEIQKKEGIKTIEIAEEKINEEGTAAKVKLKVVYGNGDEDTQDYKYIMEDGKWKYTMK